MQAAPFPLLRTPDEIRAERIALHVSQHCKQVRIALDDECLVSALPNPTRTAVFAVIAACVSGEEPVRPLSQIDVSSRPNHQMDVVRHDARTDDRKWSMVVRFGNEPEKCAVVGAIMESPQLIVTAIDDVVIVVGNDGARCTRHADRLIARAIERIAPNLSRHG